MYAAISDLQNRLDPAHLLELADDDQDSQPDPPVLESVLTDASALIDSYLASRYATPLNPTPPLLKKLTVDLALAGLFARRREAISPEYEARARSAMEVLSNLARGDLNLGAAYPPRNLSQSTRLEDARVFDSQHLENF